jgi:membrane protein YdbS with pleckstrin-like domain
VPHEPQPPHGDPASLQVFRAGRNLFKLKLLGWGVTQLLAFAGIAFWLVIFIDVEVEVNARRHAMPGQPAMTVESFAKSMEQAGRELGAKGGATGARKHAGDGFAGFKHGLVEIAMRLPWWAFPLLWALKIIGITAYFVQLPVTYLITRLDYELRWYMVTDRSLRIRVGVWKVAESTMSFANIQQVVVTQGPVQRLLGLADVRVQSAGGSSRPQQQKGEDDLHQGLFHSVTNAPQIRDLILERLRRFRETGLGDPDEDRRRVPGPVEHATESAPAPLTEASPDLLAAARELAAEARALRISLG